MEKYFEEALKEACQAYNEGEIPIGAVITYKGKIIAKAHNLKEQLNCSIYHAELLAIKEASEKLQTWRLNECDMYITMEPCFMCCGAILQSRINKVYYLVDNNKFGGIESIKKILKEIPSNYYFQIKKVEDKEYQEKITKLLKNFFSDKR